MKKEEVKQFLLNKKGYQSWGVERIATQTNSDAQTVKQVLAEIKQLEPVSETLTKNQGTRSTDNRSSIVELSKEDYEAFLAYKEFTKSLDDTFPIVNNRTKGLKPYVGNPDNVLVIGDLHCPFDLDDYLIFCREQQELFDCGTVVFIGDIIDNHYSSFHTSELDTVGPNKEFDHALDRVQQWYSVFPVATVILGNHDRIIHRQAKAAGLSDRWFKSLSEALQVYNWNFVESIVINGVNYNHGEGGTATTRMKNELQSQVQGHLHSEAYVNYSCGSNFKVFGMQVGCGVERKSYAFAYGKDSKKPMISCGVVLNKGKLPLVLPMDL